ncbi:ubiquitin carboxyl-terminal hydrolase 4 [Armillaria novae-zelandiae]|uniref:ubiquitinyl hydrolase 1 n=1 Tax=Armillaria novae-zelandiae TaxID=153914 RepID=A0AA39UIR9_9AGAR|nr:ubiquitin carboxyl-terminal hydrolase 4 [Armillaria novae-zelandiae]
MAPASTNGLVKTMAYTTVAEIKNRALESIQEEMGGASTISLIKMARRLYDQGKEYDDRSDLKAALSAYVKATSLANEADRDAGVVHEGFDDIKPMHNDLLSRTELIEDKLKAMEVQTSRDRIRETEEGRGTGLQGHIRSLLLPSRAIGLRGPLMLVSPPSAPGLGGPPFGSKLPTVPVIAPASTNRLVKTMANMTVAEIKNHALESVQRESRGATTINLIKTARRLYDQGREYDARSDLKAALSAYAEKSTGVVHKEFNDFRPTLNDLISRTKIVEEKLKATEVQAPIPSDGPIHKYGGSLATIASCTVTVIIQSRWSSFPIATTTDIIDVAVGHSTIQITSFISLFSVACFDAVILSVVVAIFPPIDELDETSSFQLPSVPTGISTSSSRSSKDGRNGLSPVSTGFSVGSPHKSPSPLKSPTPLQRATRNSTNPIEKPSNTTLITPIINSSTSRPGSLSKTKATFKPSNLSSSSTSPAPNGYPTYASPLLNGSSSPAPLINGKSLLLIDVRDRADFQREHIKRDAVICIEPTILRRKSINATSLMEALVISPPSEVSLFANRENFDYVVLYDWNSTSFGSLNSPLSVLVQTIYEREFTRMLKHAPIILVGGLEAWKKEFGEAEVTKGDGEVAKPPPSSTSTETFASANPPILQPSAKNPFANGTIPSALPSSSGGASYTEHHQVWTPGRSRADTNPSNNHPSPTLRGASTIGEKTGAISTTAFFVSYLYPDTRLFCISPYVSINFNPFLPDIASPPQASINSSLPRRRSDYIDQTQEALAGLHGSQRGPIDYPDLVTSRPLIRPPPAAASSALERQDNRPRNKSSTIGMSGLKNLGSTGYMNAPIQCLSATVPFARFFTGVDGRWKHDINNHNKLGTNGRLSGAFAKVLYDMWGQDLPYLTPIDFRSQYASTEQHDSQEFLSFLLDGIHEDLNRVTLKPPTVTLTPQEEAEMEKLPPCIASDREWSRWMSRNNSVIADYFQGQFRNQLQCMTCSTTSTTYNVFSILQLPIPSGRQVTLQQCLDALFNDEILEKDDACTITADSAHTFERFEANGRFSDKIDTFVEFPLKDLDMTSRMPLPPHNEALLNGGVVMSPNDPRRQIPPYKYDLYGVTNHTGNLSSGHYTALVRSSGRWNYCDDSSIKTVEDRDVVSQKAYVLFYKRKA